MVMLELIEAEATERIALNASPVGIFRAIARSLPSLGDDTGAAAVLRRRLPGHGRPGYNFPRIVGC